MVKRICVALIGILVMCIFLCSCHRRQDNTQNALNLTQKVHVDCYYRQHHLQRIYTDFDKIDVILRYMHKLSSAGQPPAKPAQVTDDHCQITVFLSNGTQHTYQLQSKDFLRNAQGKCFAVDAHQANVLYHLVNHIQSDNNTAHESVCSIFYKVAAIIALMVCIRFSASSKTRERSLSNTSSVTSIHSIPKLTNGSMNIVKCR